MIPAQDLDREQKVIRINAMAGLSKWQAWGHSETLLKGRETS